MDNNNNDPLISDLNHNKYDEYIMLKVWNVEEIRLLDINNAIWKIFIT